MILSLFSFLFVFSYCLSGMTIIMRRQKDFKTPHWRKNYDYAKCTLLSQFRSFKMVSNVLIFKFNVKVLVTLLGVKDQQNSKVRQLNMNVPCKCVYMTKCKFYSGSMLTWFHFLTFNSFCLFFAAVFVVFTFCIGMWQATDRSTESVNQKNKYMAMICHAK